MNKAELKKYFRQLIRREVKRQIKPLVENIELLLEELESERELLQEKNYKPANNNAPKEAPANNKKEFDRKNAAMSMLERMGVAPDMEGFETTTDETGNVTFEKSNPAGMVDPNDPTTKFLEQDYSKLMNKMNEDKKRRAGGQINVPQPTQGEQPQQVQVVDEQKEELKNEYEALFED